MNSRYLVFKSGLLPSPKYRFRADENIPSFGPKLPDRGAHAHRKTTIVSDLLLDERFLAALEDARRLHPSVFNQVNEDALATSPRAWAKATEFLLDGPNRDRIIELYSFLDDSERTRGLRPEVALIARRMWVLLNALAGWSLDVPDAGQAMGGQLIYTWDRGEHHLELEMFPSAPSEFFYLNRQTNEDWAADYTIGDALPEGMLEKLGFFTTHEP